MWIIFFPLTEPTWVQSTGKGISAHLLPGPVWPVVGRPCPGYWSSSPLGHPAAESQRTWPEAGICSVCDLLLYSWLLPQRFEPGPSDGKDRQRGRNIHSAVMHPPLSFDAVFGGHFLPPMLHVDSSESGWNAGRGPGPLSPVLLPSQPSSPSVLPHRG